MRLNIGVPFLHFYHIFGLHSILSLLEYEPPFSQQCTLFKIEVEATSVENF